MHVLDITPRFPAGKALRLARRGTLLLWHGPYGGACRLLAELKRRIGRPDLAGLTPSAAFREHRRFMAERAGVLGALLVELDDEHRIALPVAPDVRRACDEVFGRPGERRLVALQQLLGIVGASEWRRRGIHVPALDARIHPHYGVFAPTRPGYVDLVANAPLPPTGTAFDVGTGTGVLAAVLARRGVGVVVATDINPAAVTCAAANAERLGLGGRIDVRVADLFPVGRADLVVCNPPWVPAVPTSAVEHGVFDADGAMLAGFIGGLPDHLTAGGEAWLVLSDLAEHLDLRTRADLEASFAAADLTVVDRIDAPRPRTRQPAPDALEAARAAEVVSLWRLRRASTRFAEVPAEVPASAKRAGGLRSGLQPAPTIRSAIWQ